MEGERANLGYLVDQLAALALEFAAGRGCCACWGRRGGCHVSFFSRACCGLLVCGCFGVYFSGGGGFL